MKGFSTIKIFSLQKLSIFQLRFHTSNQTITFFKFISILITIKLNQNKFSKWNYNSIGDAIYCMNEKEKENWNFLKKL